MYKEINVRGKGSFNKLPIDTILKSDDGKMIVIKRHLFIEVLCLVLEKPNRFMNVYYNTRYLKKIFGTFENGYDNTISGVIGDEQSTAGGHYHNEIEELMRSFSLKNCFKIKLKDPKTGETEETELGRAPIEFQGKKYVRIIIIPRGIAHLVINDTAETMTLSVGTSGQHRDEDVFPCKM